MLRWCSGCLMRSGSAAILASVGVIPLFFSPQTNHPPCIWLATDLTNELLPSPPLCLLLLHCYHTASMLSYAHGNVLLKGVAFAQCMGGAMFLRSLVAAPGYFSHNHVTHNCTDEHTL